MFVSMDFLTYSSTLCFSKTCRECRDWYGNVSIADLFPHSLIFSLIGSRGGYTCSMGKVTYFASPSFLYIILISTGHDNNYCHKLNGEELFCFCQFLLKSWWLFARPGWYPIRSAANSTFLLRWGLFLWNGEEVKPTFSCSYSCQCILYWKWGII